MCGTSQANNIDSSCSPAGWMLSCAYFILACSAAAPWCTDLAGMLLQDGTVDFGISWYRCMSRHWKREKRSAAVLSGVSTERKGRALQLSFRNISPTLPFRLRLFEEKLMARLWPPICLPLLLFADRGSWLKCGFDAAECRCLLHRCSAGRGQAGS